MKVLKSGFRLLVTDARGRKTHMHTSPLVMHNFFKVPGNKTNERHTDSLIIYSCSAQSHIHKFQEILSSSIFNPGGRADGPVFFFK